MSERKPLTWIDDPIPRCSGPVCPSFRAMETTPHHCALWRHSKMDFNISGPCLPEIVVKLERLADLEASLKILTTEDMVKETARFAWTASRMLIDEPKPEIDEAAFREWWDEWKR